MPQSDDTLHLKSFHQPANDPAAAAAARERIASLEHQPVSSDWHQLLNQSVEHVGDMLGRLTEAPVAAPVAPQAAAPVRPAQPQPKLPSRVRPIVNALLFFLALFLVFKAPVLISQLRYNLSKPPAAPAVVTPAAATQESKISIPKINITAPIIYEPSVDEAVVQNSLRNGVVHYANTARPGEVGNAVIVGHSSNDWWEPGDYKFIFVLLDKLTPGDKITVSYQGKYYVYEVFNTKVVEPTDLSVVEQPADHILTLITCTPPGTSWKRLIVQAKQTSPKPTAGKVATTQKEGSVLLPGNAPGITDQLSRFWRNLTRGGR